MHLKNIRIDPDKFPVRDRYPFNLKVFQGTRELEFHSPVTLFMGENGTGKSTLLRAVSHKCGIHIWQYDKIGKGEVLRCHKERIDRDYGNCSTHGGKIWCSCGNSIGIDKGSYYKMIDRAFTYSGTKRNA